MADAQQSSRERAVALVAAWKHHFYGTWAYWYLSRLESPGIVYPRLVEAVEAEIERADRAEQGLWRERFWRAFHWFSPGPTSESYWCGRVSTAEADRDALRTELAQAQAASSEIVIQQDSRAGVPPFATSEADKNVR